MCHAQHSSASDHRSDLRDRRLLRRRARGHAVPLPSRHAVRPQERQVGEAEDQRQGVRVPEDASRGRLPSPGAAVQTRTGDGTVARAVRLQSGAQHLLPAHWGGGGGRDQHHWEANSQRPRGC